MTLEELARDDGQLVERYEYGEETVLAVDFGATKDGAVDVVDGSVIVVLEDEQREFDLPDGTDDAQAFMKNGVLSVELEAH